MPDSERPEPITILRDQAIPFAVLQQILLLLLSAMVLDGGRIFRLVVIAAIAHWLLILWSLWSAPSRLDFAIVRWSFIPLIVLVGAIAALAGR